MGYPWAVLVDRFERVIENLRISVTDRCDLRCVYCLPDEDIEWVPRAEILTLEEISRISRVAVEQGVRKIRITGGEPLLRRDLETLIAYLRAIPGLRDVSLTTNGTQLARKAEALYKAGLHRINVSLDTLHPGTFFRMAQRQRLEAVLEGLETAQKVGMHPIRINTVPIRGVNDGEILNFARLTRERGYEWRFIEFMPLEAGQVWGPERLVPGEEVRERIHALYPLELDPTTHPSQPARDYLFADGAPGKVGFINTVTQPFCERCNRIRLTADGKLRTCLFSLDDIDLLDPLRSGATDEDLAAILVAAVGRKEQKHHITDGLFVKPARTMSRIGG
jgi:cyclic pyranopterin phosphate synthase